LINSRLILSTGRRSTSPGSEANSDEELGGEIAEANCTQRQANPAENTNPCLRPTAA
jgi:hypothetical protein